MRRARRPLLLALVLAALAPAAARADWNGDGTGDVLAVDGSGRLLLYGGNGAGGFTGPAGTPIGSGSAVVHCDCCGRATSAATACPTCWRRTAGRAADPLPRERRRRVGDRQRRADRQRLGSRSPADPARRRLQRRRQAGRARPPHRRLCCSCTAGNGAGGWVTGSGRADRQRLAVVHRARWPGGDFSGDGRPDVLARRGDGDAADVSRRRHRWVDRRGRASRSAPAGGPFAAGSPPAATSAATAGRTSSPGSPTARSCSTAATAPAASWPAPASRSAQGWHALSHLTLVTQPPSIRRRRRSRPARRCPTARPGSTPACAARRPAAACASASGCGAAPAGRRRTSAGSPSRPRRPTGRRPAQAVPRTAAARPPAGRARALLRARLLRRAGSDRVRHKTVSRRFTMCL